MDEDSTIHLVWSPVFVSHAAVSIEWNYDLGNLKRRHSKTAKDGQDCGNYPKLAEVFRLVIFCDSGE